MARTPEGDALTESHRRLQARLATAVSAAVALVWQAVDPLDLRGSLDGPVDAAALIVRRGAESSAAASGEYYARYRRAEGVGGTFGATLAVPPSAVYVRGLLLGAGVRGIRNAQARGASVDAARGNGLVRLLGSGLGVVADGGRQTILGAIVADRAAHGYQRVTDASPCAFCAMLASRGIVRYDATSAGFQAHGHCGCTAEPAFEGSVISPVNAKFRDAWQTATNGLSGPDAINAFRAHLAS